MRAWLMRIRDVLLRRSPSTSDEYRRLLDDLLSDQEQRAAILAHQSKELKRAAREHIVGA